MGIMLFPKQGDRWLTPPEVVTRLQSESLQVSTDRAQAQLNVIEEVVRTYARELDKDCDTVELNPFDKLFNQYFHALQLTVSDSSTDASVSFSVQVEEPLFVGEVYPTLTDHPNSCLVMRIAKILGYVTKGE